MSSYASTSAAPWPAFLPPSLRALSDPRSHPNPSALPASRRPWTTKPAHKTLQDELDELEADEDDFYNQMMDVRQYGYSWLVPLGRQNTHNEDAEDAFHPHALPSSPAGDDANASFDSATGAPFTAGQGQGHGSGQGGTTGGDVPPEAPVRDLDAEIEDADASSEEDEEEDGSEEGSAPSERGVETVAAGGAGVGGEDRRGGESGGEESMQM
ncbi:hypothetical protein JCM11251_005207 [Rhodosporidiobolus azoricus]